MTGEEETGDVTLTLDEKDVQYLHVLALRGLQEMEPATRYSDAYDRFLVEAGLTGPIRNLPPRTRDTVEELLMPGGEGD